jgi:hypothetical protein
VAEWVAAEVEGVEERVPRDLGRGFPGVVARGSLVALGQATAELVQGQMPLF